MITKHSDWHIVFLLASLTILYMPTTVAQIPPTSPLCPECGTIQKSGKLSCCARGGSWFGNCGSGRTTQTGHSWYEGIQACTARQSQTVVGQQLHAPQPKGNASSGGVSMGMNSKAVMTANVLPSAPANTSALMSDAAPITASTTTSINTSARMPIDTPVPSTALSHQVALESTAYYIDMTTTSAIPAITHTLENTQTPIVAILPRNASTNLSAGGAIINLIHHSADISRTILSRTSTSASNLALEVKHLLHLVTHMSIILVIV